MAAHTEHLDEASKPTADKPDQGDISFGGIVISHALHWVEDGVHVFRSTEFDVIAADEDLRVAVGKFINNAEDLADTYTELGDDITPMEAEQAVELLRRQLKVYRALNDAARRRPIRLNLYPSRRRRKQRGGFHSSAPGISPPRQLV